MQTQTQPHAHKSSDTILSVTFDGPYGEQTERMLNEWWAAGVALLWVPIIDVDGTEENLTEAQELAAELDGGWLIQKPLDLLTLPEGLKGWLLPLNADDTDIVCGRWRRHITFMRVINRQTGAVATFQSTAG